MTRIRVPISPVVRKLSAYIAEAPRRALPQTVTERAMIGLTATDRLWITSGSVRQQPKGRV